MNPELTQLIDAAILQLEFAKLASFKKLDRENAAHIKTLISQARKILRVWKVDDLLNF